MNVSTAEKLLPEEIFFSPELIDRFAACKARLGYTPSSVTSYMAAVRGLYKWLPADDKYIRADSLPGWLEWLRSQGRPAATIQTKKTILNDFMEYIGHPEWQVVPPRRKLPEPEDITPPLSRDEYLALLRAARRMGRERAYLLIKTIGCTGINSTEMSVLTVEALQKGRASPACYNRRRLVEIPEPLRSELLAYAARQGIAGGPVFMAKNGVPMSYALIWKDIKQVCREAGVAETQGGPKNLARMQAETYKALQRENLLQTDQAYRRLLEREERLIGWDI